MPVPAAIPLALLGASSVVSAGANWYSQSKQRDLYRYQRAGYERQYRDWFKNVQHRTLKYPEFTYPGHIRALDTGISQSYAASLGTGAQLTRQLTGNTLYRRHQSGGGLYNRSAGRSSRFL